MLIPQSAAFSQPRLVLVPAVGPSRGSVFLVALVGLLPWGQPELLESLRYGGTWLGIGRDSKSPVSICCSH